MNIVAQLRAFRLKELAKVVPRGASGEAGHCCEACGGPARLAVGRRTGAERLIPMACKHWPHLPGQQPMEVQAQDGIVALAITQLRELKEDHAARDKRVRDKARRTTRPLTDADL